MYDVVALGELLVDFTPCGVSAQELPVYQANPGGAPCNVLSMLSRLGRRTAFIGKVGHDMFGKMLRRTLQEEGIDDSGLVSSREVNTTLAFVQIDEHGDRDFSFYRNPGADMKLTSGEV
ncbi:PfkB family carbohydrate kinase, partial [Akkermansia sp.]